MKILVEERQLFLSSQELLRVSRNVRQLGNEVYEVEKNLRNLSGLEQCRTELRRQMESIELLTGRLVNLSTALNDIAALYVRTEDRNESCLDDTPVCYAGTVKGDLYRGTDIHNKVQDILKK